VGEKRFGEWLENNVDWALSRDRFWGTPLNIWVCDDCGTQTSIGSRSELCTRGSLAHGAGVPEDIELHRPYIDEVTLSCDKCGGTMHRTPEVIDCWFDSGSMPFAQWHYPFENADRFDQELFPADFISEGIDQTRGWFYSMLTIATLLKGVSSYKSCLVNDLILDKNGQKMSKSKGNTVDPIALMHEYGADAIRWYLLEVSPPWVPTRFNVDGVREINSKFIGTLKNVYSFYATYANIDGFEAGKYATDWQRSVEIDRWIVSRLHSLVAEVRRYMEGYEFSRVLRALQDFVIDELSNWYVRRSRRRFWALELTEDKIEAYRTLYQVLVEVSRLISPFAPYLADELYINLTGEESVHLVSYPDSQAEYIDTALEAEMQAVIDVVSLGRTARGECGIKIRQPLGRMYVPARLQPVLDKMQDLVQEELNIHTIEYIAEDSDFVQYELKPQFKAMGPKYGKQIKAIASHLESVDGATALRSFATEGVFRFEFEGSTVELVPEDLMVQIRPQEGFVFASLKDIFVALDTTLSEELIREGYARELINKIQFTRKEQGFEIMDRIIVRYQADAEVRDAITEHREYIMNETLADALEAVEDTSLPLMEINGRQAYLSVEKVVV
ncbi:MAG TPA: class I tRNA ligase family protein, partial [Candidatus Cloacimonadota bacterium]|nr:class I tRNA ligase family protein [Candidatus Cloacimonadota bacterium]